MKWLGYFVLACYAIHCGYHLIKRRPEDILWACHVGTALVGLGLSLNWPTVNGIGLMLLIVGVPLWVLDVASGGEFAATSLLSHLGGLFGGLLGVMWMGMPIHVWWKAALVMAGLLLVCRLATPSDSNVNVAFAVRGGWEHRFPSHVWYLAMLAMIITTIFFMVEYGMRRWVRM